MNEFSNGMAHSILVIDDELLNGILCQFLQGKGFVTESAYSYVQAIALLKSGAEFDLIILDYQLGDGTGIEFLADLHGYRQVSPPPVIMISASQEPAFLESCFANGIADFLIKPVNFSLLALKVGALIQTVAMQQLIALQNAELERFKTEAEQEEQVAKFIYEYLLRQNSQVIDGVTSWLKSSSAFSGDITLTKVSPCGDFYFLLADATGHGLSAAITLMPVISIFNSMIDKAFHLQPIVTEINKKLLHDTPENRFVAAIMLRWRCREGIMDVWNGGMPMMYWVQQGDVVHRFTSQHMPLGILEEALFDDSIVSCTVAGEGTLVAYSDGLIEEVNGDGVSFSAQRVAETVCANPNDILQSLVNELEQYAGRKNYRDDISICTLDLSRILVACRQLPVHESPLF